MRRMEAAVAILELLDRRRAEASDEAHLALEQIERDLVDLCIHDLDPEGDVPAGMESASEYWLRKIPFLVIAMGPYAVLVWLLWPGQ